MATACERHQERLRKRGLRPGRASIVEVAWIDSHAREGWRAGVPTPEFLEILTVGYLTASTRKFVQVAQSAGDNGDWDEVLCIPRVCVRRVRVVGKSRGITNE